MSAFLTSIWRRLPALVRASISALAVLLIAQLTILGVVGNLKFYQATPWALPATLVLLAAFWHAVTGGKLRSPSAAWRGRVTRRNPLPWRVWRAALASIFFSIIAVLALRLMLPSILPMAAPTFAVDVSGFSPVVVMGMALSIAISAGVTEEVVFRGYLQQQLEEAYGIAPAILVTGLCFWLAHTDKVTITHLPFHMLASLLLGLLAYLTKSLWPAILAHSASDAILVPAYAFHQPAFAWSSLTARPIWEGSDAATPFEKMRLVLQALDPGNLLVPGPHRTFAILATIFLLTGALAVSSFGRLAAVARLQVSTVQD